MNTPSTYNDKIGISIPEDSSVLEFKNSHGGFHGDGYFEDGGHIPRDIKNGIYYFRDRYAENYPEEADIDINERWSYNFTVAIFDLDKNKLYICELDT
ncbi:hypothetical protein [Terrisporobacter mayombei]|uniref:Uncharacterized protein n=1 Tax=Terrisporobacter mayombei TaxID=1541 RepID=A0ABY9Q3H0_9FIRM|nr:hypothetical protein [Terrisporobacter mayombei]MCC3866888.1 hypothetical protein [Terrisporobacter mayombei]WMT81132.1 hypothetical protein TEMA_14640 [Terrisporobacter mayombei]